MMGLIWGGGTYAWNSPAVLACLCIGCGALVILAIHQYFFKTDGLFDRRLFQSRNLTLCLAGLFVEGMVYITFNVYFGEMTSVLYHPSPMILAVRFSAFNLGTLAASPFCSWYIYRYKRVKELLVAGYTLFLIAVIGLATATPGSSKVVNFYCAVAGVGFAAPIALLFTVAQLAVIPEVIGLASSLLITFRSIGGALGTAIAGAVFRGKLGSALPSYIGAVAVKNGVAESSIPDFIAGITGDDPTTTESIPGVTASVVAAGLAAMSEAYSHSFHYVWYVVLPFLVVALVCVAVLAPINKQMTYIIDRPVEEIHHHHHHTHVDAEKPEQENAGKDAVVV